mmetsp:Transcript_44091/g.37003  ORF Transcript_44091/g.37003 Transcript_44091/m.37003 type:complete len:80 (+) Transcript_44091:629-868(+)
MLSGGKDKIAVLYDLINNSLIMTYLGHIGSVNSAVISTCNQIVVTGSSDKTVKIWNTMDGSLIYTKKGHTLGVKAVSLL